MSLLNGIKSDDVDHMREQNVLTLGSKQLHSHVDVFFPLKKKNPLDGNNR